MNTPKRPHKKKGRKADKIGRNARPVLHRTKGFCTRKGCVRLAQSRVWDRNLGTYVPR